MRPRLHAYLLAAVLLIVASLMIVCGGNSSLMQQPSSSTPSVSNSSSSSSSSSPPSLGSVVIFGKDAPVCDVLSFTVTITAASLTPQGGGTPVSVLASGKPITVDFARLMDFATILNTASLAAGTYSSLTLTISNPQLTVLDVATIPPAAITLATTLTSSTVSVPIQPALQVAGSASAGLEVDFDLLKSIQTDMNGQVTGTVSPVFDASPSIESSDNGLGELDDLEGLVQSVTTTGGSPAFIGSFSLATDDGSTRVVNVTSSTQFDTEENDSAQQGSNILNQLAAGTFVEVDAFVDSSGNIVAKSVEVEEQEDASQHKSAIVGLVSSVARDTSGAATQFTLIVRNTMPEEGPPAAAPTLELNFSVAKSTRFKITAQGVNEAQLQFDPTTLGVGQEVVVHAQMPSTAGPGTGVVAKAIFLRLRSVVGNFSALLSPSPAGNSGGFTFLSCGALFHGQPITVVTFDNTAFAGVSGLTGLTTQPELVVKGLLFYEQKPLTVNGVGAVVPGWVLEAKQVHQLNP